MSETTDGRPPADVGTATGCGAPHAALYLSPSGAVQACCRNNDLTLRTGAGPGRQSLREIWNGPAMARLRQAVDADDYSLGCQSCGLAIAAGERAASVAADFDRYLHVRDLPLPKHLDLALSNTCNLTCEMCNGDLSSSIRSQREHRPPLRSPYDDAFFEELRELLPAVESVIFKGGEPFLAREAQRTWDLMIELGCDAHVTVVTNGTRWNDAVERWARALRMDVHVSIDGATDATIEAIRTGADGAQVRRNLRRFVELTASYGGSVVWNFCHMPQNSHELGLVLTEADALDIDVHVIPVESPPRFDLTRLEPGRLDQLLRTREREEVSLLDRLGRNRPVWEQEIAKLRRLVATRSEPTSVPIGVPRRSDRSAFDAEVDQLAARSGREPIRVTIDDALIAHVDAPTWAAAFEPGGWRGRGAQDLVSIFEAHLGPPLGSAAIVERPPVVETSIRFGSHDHPWTVRSVRSAGRVVDGAERIDLAIAVLPGR